MSNINRYADDLLLEFGDAVHVELKRVLRGKFGDDWLPLGVRKHFKEEQFARVEKMLQNPLRVVEMYKSSEEIHGLDHFWNIVQGNWDFFEGVFQDRVRAQVYFSEIAELRNNLAHRMQHHVLLKSDLIRIAGNCRMVLSALESRRADRFAEIVNLLVAGGSPWGSPLEGRLPPSDEIYTEFVGRPGELNDLSDWLESDSPQILVWGYGGAGKSALAHKFARDVKEGSRDDLIAVCWVSAKRSEYIEGGVRERPADFANLDGLVRAIWAALYGAEDVTDGMAPTALIKELIDMPTLLVVDDFDTISEDVALSQFLMFELRNTPTRVLYTSRQRVPGIRNLEVPPFSDQELREFVGQRSIEYGVDHEQCFRRLEGIKSVTQGYPLFVDDLVHHAALVGVDTAMSDWTQKKGYAAREYALRRQVEYLGHSSGEVLIALSVANRALIPVEISNIAGLTDGDTEGGLNELLKWRMVNRVIEDGSLSPGYRMNTNTIRLVQQTFRDDNRLKTYSAAFKVLTGERVPEAKKNAIGKIVNRIKELARGARFEEARDFLVQSMAGELTDSPDLYGVLGWLYSQQPLERFSELARDAFERSHNLGSSKVDTYYHWTIMEKNIAEWMITNAHEGNIASDKISEQWNKCEKVAETGIQRCGLNQLLCYWAGYAASREAKARDRAQSFSYAQGVYARSMDWFRKALDAPVSDVSTVNKGLIYRGLTLAFDGLNDVDELRKTLLNWYAFSGPDQHFETECRRLTSKYQPLRLVRQLQSFLAPVPS